MLINLHKYLVGERKEAEPGFLWCYPVAGQRAQTEIRKFCVNTEKSNKLVYSKRNETLEYVAHMWAVSPHLLTPE